MRTPPLLHPLEAVGFTHAATIVVEAVLFRRAVV
jgi:hypothetical protein